MMQVPQVWCESNRLLRDKLRRIEPSHWKKPHPICKEIRTLGASEDVSRQVVINSRC